MKYLIYLLKLVAIISLILIIYYLILKILNKIYHKNISKNISNLPYIRADDEKAQQKYDELKKDIKIPKKDAIELSWQFLYDITEYIFSKFSKKDKQEVENIGLDLISSGMQYQHVIELGIEHEKEEKVKQLMRNKLKSHEQNIQTLK